MFILSPTTIVAAILSSQVAIFLGVSVILFVALFIISPYLLDWVDNGLLLSPAFLLGILSTFGIIFGFIGFYVYRTLQKVKQLNRALFTTQLALVKEQKISSLGALAVAAAHELGSPLSTISITVKEILPTLSPDDPLMEDIQILVSQSERCRNILLQLSHQSTEEDQPKSCEKVSLSEIIHLAAKPHQIPSIALSIHKESPNPEPNFSVTPDLLHSLGNILQNAFQYAKSHVQVTLRWGKQSIEVAIHDDGPGYPPTLLARLGDPYASSRINPKASGHKALGLGLGLFIAKTLLSHLGAQVHFSNDKGAYCLIKWFRIEA
jgi:two-component system sensor histidine kinase RegB